MRTLSLIVSSLLLTATLAADPAPPLPSSSERTLYVCSARTLLGRRFSATGEDKVLTQEAAMQKCESFGLRCYRTGCVETVAP